MKQNQRTELGACGGLTWVVATIVLVAACGPQATEEHSPEPSARLSVYTVNYPLKYFTERIGGDLVEVQFPAPADGDPALWQPDVEAIAAYQSADLILLNGADYAKWVSMVSLPSAKLIDTGAGFADRLIELEGHTTHSHGPEGEHAHGGWAFTTWLDPELAAAQAGAIRDALSERLPEAKLQLAERCSELTSELMAVDSHLRSIFSAGPDRPLLFSHPVYQYFERRYGLNGRSVHWEPDEAPSEAMWAELEELLQEHPARWMVWEGEPLPETAAALETLGVHSVVFDHCGNTPDAGDLLSIWQEGVSQIRSAYGGR